MKKISTYKGQTYKEVTVGDIDDNDTDEAIFGFACAHAGESRSSVFDWDVRRWPATTTATVTFYTD